MESFEIGIKTDWVSDEYIKINNCSSRQILSTPTRNLRPNGRDDWTLLFITEGKCYLDVDSQSPITVNNGNVIIYAPKIPHDYSFLPKDKPAHIYVHFSGTGCEELFDRLQIPRSGYIPYQITHEIDNYLMKLCESFANADIADTVYCNGLLIAILSLISPLRHASSNRQQFPKVINGIIADIRSSPASNYDVDQWAKECGFTRSYFIQVFKKATGMAPHRYLTQVRINYAKEMLIFTDIPAAKIGEICGYPDNNYFSRIFKKIEGVSPTQYRKNKQK
ncbi:MAG: helix-turn-helix transcriptional regulator [Clostridia bacterium]|nr:helix-turn-helix transcriptional regulator [Clostridia bacterium]